MIYSKNKKFIFFHIPKNAGTSFSQALIKYNDINFELEVNGFNQHIKPSDFYNLNSEIKHDDFFKFVVVRNPYDRLISLYRYLKGDPQNPTHSFIKEAKSYKDWLFNYYPHSKDRQYDWTHDKNENLAIDFIAKYENLSDDVKRIEEILNIRVQLEWKNKSHFNDGAFNDAESIHFINKLLDKEFKLLDYKKY